jgi:predicted Rossmann-fold nucleotide-binding protein
MTKLSLENKSFKDPLTRSPSYFPADRDTEFLQRDELRSVRIGLELLKAELIQREQGMRSAIVVFGSARLQESAATRETLQLAELESARRPNDSSCQQHVALARRQLNLSAYYDVAREFGRLVSSSCQVDGRCEYVLVTGKG